MTKPKILSGGNPQIPKGYGEEAVQAFLDAVPATGPGGWKNAACRRIDSIVSAEVPGVQKAVKWNSPLYAAPDAESRDHFFLSFHCFDKYVKVSFFRGGELDPPPEEKSKPPWTAGSTVFDPSPVNPLSIVTVGSLDDMGYDVTYGSADPFTLPGGAPRQASLRGGRWGWSTR